jgi:hypothetical protein
MVRLSSFADVGPNRDISVCRYQYCFAMTTTFPKDGIQNLILNNKGDRSYERLSRDSGGHMSPKALHKAATGVAKAFGDAVSILGLSQALNIPVSDIIRAYAVSMGLPVIADDCGVLRINGAGTLPKSSQDLLIGLARELRNAYEMPLAS